MAQTELKQEVNYKKHKTAYTLSQQWQGAEAGFKNTRQPDTGETIGATTVTEVKTHGGLTHHDSPAQQFLAFLFHQSYQFKGIQMI